MSDIKKLRAKTGAGVMDAKKALVETKGDMKKATAWVSKKGLAKAKKKSGRATQAGVIFSYIHHNQRSGTIVELACETDFVAKTQDFVTLAKELAMQINSMNPKDVKGLLNQEYNRDPKLTIKELIAQKSGKLGENIQLKRFQRFEIGDK